MVTDFVSFGGHGFGPPVLWQAKGPCLPSATSVQFMAIRVCVSGGTGASEKEIFRPSFAGAAATPAMARLAPMATARSRVRRYTVRPPLPAVAGVSSRECGTDTGREQREHDSMHADACLALNASASF